MRGCNRHRRLAKKVPPIIVDCLWHLISPAQSLDLLHGDRPDGMKPDARRRIYRTKVLARPWYWPEPTPRAHGPLQAAVMGKIPAPSRDCLRWCVLLDGHRRADARRGRAARERAQPQTDRRTRCRRWPGRRGRMARPSSSISTIWTSWACPPSRRADWGRAVAVHPEDRNGLAATWQRIMASAALRRGRSATAPARR